MAGGATGGSGGGTYTLLVALGSPATVGFGAAGERDLRDGWYAYTGSALGPGGFARVERHRELARGKRDVRHWHLDALLGHPDARLAADVRSPGVDAECAVARGIADAAEPVPGVGATDCACDAHLAFAPHRGDLRSAIDRAHAAARG